MADTTSRSEPEAYERYRHFKGGEYEVICMANDASVADRRLVIYQSLDTRKIWVRPLSEWNSLVQVEIDGPEQPRFKRI